ncbi:Uncharacterised protein [Yersinia similis]|nr:Uncharacterised protein [Yersinia similis]
MHAELAHRVRVAKTKSKIVDAVLFQQGGDDLFHRGLLEDAGIAPQAGAPQRRADHHAVAGLMKTGIALFKAGDHAGHAALQYPFAPDKQRGVFIQYRRKIHRRIGTRQPDIEHKRRGEHLAQGEIHHRKGLGR